MQTAISTAIFYAQIQDVKHIPSEIIFILLTVLIISTMALLLFILLDIRNLINKHDLRTNSDTPVRKLSFESNCKQYFLTSREIEILKLIGTGKPYKIIASELNISEKTVKNHVRNMYEKTGVSNKMELVSRINGS